MRMQSVPCNSGASLFTARTVVPFTCSLLQLHCPCNTGLLLVRHRIILHAALYGCETWSLTLSDNSLSVFENGVLSEIFGTKREEVTDRGIKLHSDERRDLCC